MLTPTAKRASVWFGLLGLVALLALAACAALGGFNARAQGALQTITASRAATLDLLKARVITPERAQQVQNDATEARKTIDAAIELHALDPEAGEGKLESARASIRMLKGIVAARMAKGGKP